MKLLLFANLTLSTSFGRCQEIDSISKKELSAFIYDSVYRSALTSFRAKQYTEAFSSYEVAVNHFHPIWIHLDMYKIGFLSQHALAEGFDSIQFIKKTWKIKRLAKEWYGRKILEEDWDSDPIDRDSIESNLIDPSFSAGMPKFYKYLRKNLKYPKWAKSIGHEGRVLVRFIVNRDGSISSVKILEGLGKDFDEQCSEIVMKSPSWNPGSINGRKTYMQMILPITFSMH